MVLARSEKCSRKSFVFELLTCVGVRSNINIFFFNSFAYGVQSFCLRFRFHIISHYHFHNNSIYGSKKITKIILTQHITVYTTQPDAASSKTQLFNCFTIVGVIWNVALLFLPFFADVLKFDKAQVKIFMV